MTSKPRYGENAPPPTAPLSAADLAGALDDVLAESAPSPPPEQDPPADLQGDTEEETSNNPSRGWDQAKILDYIGQIIAAELEEPEPEPVPEPEPAQEPAPEPELIAAPESEPEPEFADAAPPEPSSIEAVSPTESHPTGENSAVFHEDPLDRDSMAPPHGLASAPSEILSPGIVTPDLVAAGRPPSPLLQQKPDDLPSLESLLRTLKTLHGDPDEPSEPRGTASAAPSSGGMPSLETVLGDLRRLYGGGRANRNEPTDGEDDEDVLVLDDRFLAEPAPDSDDDILVLDDRFIVETGRGRAGRTAKRKAAAAPGASVTADQALVELLADPPPAEDGRALDCLFACWPAGTTGSRDGQLAAVAVNLARPFGGEHRLPQAALAAWRMLDEGRFAAEFARQLTAIADMVAAWEGGHVDFPALDSAEYALIEHLFDHLAPSHHGELLARVMALKGLSHRRIGMLRRVPFRLNRTIEPLIRGGRLDEALVELAATKALMTRVAAPPTVAPVAKAALKAFNILDRMTRILTG